MQESKNWINLESALLILSYQMLSLEQEEHHVKYISYFLCKNIRLHFTKNV